MVQLAIIECRASDLEVSLDALVTVGPCDELLALAGARLLHALPGAAHTPGGEAGAGPTQRKVPSLLCACVTPAAGQPGPAGALTRGRALTSLRALRVTLTRGTGLASTLGVGVEVIVRLTLLTLSPVSGSQDI